MARKNEFMCGAACVIANIITSHGMDTPVEEAYCAVFGNATLKQLEKAGVDEFDLKVIKEHWHTFQYRLNRRKR